MAYGAKDPIRSPQIPQDPAVEVMVAWWHGGAALVDGHIDVDFVLTSSKMWRVVGDCRDFPAEKKRVW